MISEPTTRADREGPPAELPTGYYLEHFLTLLDAVEGRYDDLLLDEERVFGQRFRGLPLPAKRLYVRLVSRKGPVFRADRLVYPEIPDLPGAAANLTAAGLLAIDPPEHLEAAFALLTAPELRDLARVAGLAALPSARKPELQEQIRTGVSPDHLSVDLSRRFQWWVPLGVGILRVFRLLFFGTPEPDLTPFVLSDLGMVRFETYPLLSSHRLFTSRSEVDRALRLRELREELAAVLEGGAATSAGPEVERLTDLLPDVGTPSEPDGHPSAAAGHPLLIRWRRRFLEDAARFWERVGRPDRALDLYADPTTFPARERRARLLARQGRSSEALALCKEIRDHPRDPEEEEVAETLAARLRVDRGNRPETGPPGPPTPETLPPPAPDGRKPAIETLVLPGPAPERIETRVLEAVEAAGRPGFEAENRFWTSLFALFFWEEIFLPIPRAFGHPFQWGPSDLFSDGFRPAREPAIGARLAELCAARDNAWKHRLLDRFDRKRGTANALVTWEAISRPILERSLQVLPAPHVAAIFERLSRNPGGFKTGFPDLFLFTPEPPGYLLAEVKSPGDRLQLNQKSWLRYFSRHGIPATVIQVEYPRS